jgi:hypothetical protein
MLGQSYACLGGLEISNGNRVLTYTRNIGIGIPGNVGRCECDALDLAYPFSDPATDPAPWYDADVPESEEFLGVWLREVYPQPNMSRASTSRAGGGILLGPLSVGRRIVSCSGVMFATSGVGMAYGEAWLREALSGGCGCEGDDLQILRACPPTDEYGDYDRYFRTLINAGIVSPGPEFHSVNKDCSLQEVEFQFATGPYLFGPKETLTEDYELQADTPYNVMASTTTWPGDGVLVITIENQDQDDPTDEITIQGRVSFDGTCDNLEGMPCFDVTVSALDPGEIIIIDGQRESLGLYKPGPKVIYPALGKVTASPNFPYFDFPTVGACTVLCLTFTSASTNQPKVTVDFYAREL